MIQLRRCLAALVIALSAVGGAVLPAQAQIEGDITRGTFEPMPVAVPAFAGDTPEATAVGADIAGVIASDLGGSGLFRMIGEDAFIERNLDISVLPRFADWKVVQAEALVVGRTYLDPTGRLVAQFRLYDVFAGRQLFSQEYAVPSQESWRRIAHIIADDVYEQLTGDGGYFDTRVVFIAESGPKTNRTRRLAIMDQDGANPEFLTDGRYEVLTPRFSPSSQTIIYTALVPDRVNPRIERRRVFLFDIETGRQEVIGDFPGMSFAARFAPDGRSVAMSMEQAGNSDIYVMDLARRNRVRLTTSQAIDTSPSYAPEGDRIVFNSDRGGSSQLYVMNADGRPMSCPSGGSSDACRITFGQGRYSTPVWSPRGDLIAFTKQANGRFYIGVIKPDGTGERLLTEAYLDEGPTWSPNGRVIAFFRERAPGAQPQLWSVDLSGRNLKLMTTPGSASDPAWSPVLR